MTPVSQNNDRPIPQDHRLNKWLNREKPAVSGLSGIKSLPANQKAPLSFGQLRLWFLQQLNPDNPFYHYAERYSIEGNLHKEHFIDCFYKIISRHDILRTTFPDSDGAPWQEINEVMAPEILELDIRSLGEAERTSKVHEITLQVATKPFDLETGPLIRLALFQLEDSRHQLVLVMHHIIADQWSMDIIRNEWASYYRKLEPEPTGALRYADFVYHQRLQKFPEVNQQYWEKKLAGELPKLEFPLSQKRHISEVTYRGACYEWVLSPEISRNVQKLCRECETTMFVLLLSVFKTLLFRYTGESDLSVATPVSNRHQVMLEKMIGFFNETIVLRDKLTGNMSFLELVRTVQATVMEAFAHQEIPFESIVRALKPERMISSNPLFQVMFLYHKVSEPPSLGDGLSWDYRSIDIGVSKFDLTLHISENKDQITAVFEYAHDLFTRSAIEKMHVHLNTLISGIIENPNASLSRLSLVTDSEREKILTEWNHSIYPSIPYNSIMDLIEPAIRKHPERIAVVSKECSLSYAELNLLVGHLSMLLVKENIGPGKRVGICTEKSPEMIIGMLAVLKTGAAYLPMDASYPLSRMKHMISDAETSVILTQEHLMNKFTGLPARIICISPTRSEPFSQSDSYRPGVQPSSTAYIMYTSGSTGLPKGVPITHGNLVSSTLARISYYPQHPRVFLLMSSFSFDSSVAGIFWALCSGGTLVLAEDRIEQDMATLSDLIDRHQVTHTLLLPSLYNLLLLHGTKEKLRSLNTVIVAGESCTGETCANHFKILPEAQLYNEYGPTEATVWSTVHRVQEIDSPGLIPIGRPVENSRVYLLDQNLDLVPAGVAGEIYICGTGISPGYLNLPEQTRLRFIPSPFKEDSGLSMYKTGDLGRYNEDGLIEFLGRADQQIKLRGYRVEPDEINRVMLKFPGLTESAVVLNHSNQTVNLQQSTSAGELVSILEDMDPEMAEKLLRSVESIDQFKFNQWSGE